MERGTSSDRHPWFGQPTKRQTSKNYGRLGGWFEVILVRQYGVWQLKSATHFPES